MAFNWGNIGHIEPFNFNKIFCKCTLSQHQWKEERQNFSLVSFHWFPFQPFCTNLCHMLCGDRSVICTGLNKLEAHELRSLHGHAAVLALQGVGSVDTACSYPKHLQSWYGCRAWPGFSPFQVGMYTATLMLPSNPFPNQGGLKSSL